ncbi:hypothetical protein [Herbaspirillum sp. C9C3]|uniref:hypothetical protein n=1 Tax=Herbaspirillum sp. C9C3 TaxID=2735271 RepID=UPI001584F657|nr:hypothetical protein [Herbaspirillum sp. C9C3]NUT63272.1 hypothetical protein [Herbaspirillum sp. C9C3]
MPASDTSSADEVRILNSISDGKKKARSNRSGNGAGTHKPRRVLFIVLLLLLVAGGITLAALRLHGHDGGSTSVQASATRSRPPPAAAAPASTTDTGPASGVASAATDTAVINDTSAPAPDPAADSNPARGPDQLTSALEEGVKPPPATLKNALEAKPEKTVKPPRSTAQHEEKKRKAAKAENRNDSDVDLIKALVARSGEVEKKRSPEGAGNANGGDGASGQGTPAKSSQAHPGPSRQKDARNVDVVERKNGESTASLLQRCHALGFVEGEFCRWRICSGRWDSDPACKVANTNN